MDARIRPFVVEQRHWKLGDMEMGYALSRFDGAQCIEVDNAESAVQLHFGLRGDYAFYHKQLGRKFDLLGGHLNILYSQSFGMVLENKSAEIETFGLRISPARFLEWSQGLEGRMGAFAAMVADGKAAIVADQWPGLDLPLEITIRQILSHPFEGRLAELFLEAKAMELWALAAEACQHADLRMPQHIKNSRDKAAIIAARELIQSRLDAPMSLSALAKAVGINAFKLKHGFKEHFGETVLAYTTRLRLEWALQLLRDTDMQVADIAYKLGYATPGHFGQQFKQHFHCTPNSVRKNP